MAIEIKSPKALLAAINSALNIFFYQEMPEELTLKVSEMVSTVKVEVVGQDKKTVGMANDVLVGDTRWLKTDLERRKGELTKTAAVRALADYTEKKLFWGSLEGVRPGNLYRLLLERGFNLKETELILMSVYGLSSEKAKLLQSIYLKQAQILTPNTKRAISLYIGIPFCPTRCAYCSFAAYPLSTHGHLKKQFLKALFQELTELNSYFSANEISVASVYIGGGTPTTLTALELQELLELVPFTKELTVEAGRPDSIDRPKLAALKAGGVNRVCVNPQTLNQKTLDLLGRSHTVEQFFQAVSLVREVKIPVLNIDLIAGLPGEKVSDMEFALDNILALAPENVTVHTLAAKRASGWYKNLRNIAWPLETETLKMVELASKRLEAAHIKPYYLYRQRHMAANLENIGYAIAGTECYYNIVMIEELQTVVGLGAGASTRFLGEKISRVINPKCPATYSQRVGDLIQSKKENLSRLFG